jgi:nucleoside-diphosphate-sugar epimerase
VFYCLSFIFKVSTYTYEEQIMTRILLTNATGYIGSAVARAFKAKGHDVSAIARNDEAKKKLEKEGIKAYSGDLTNPDSIVAAAVYADVVVHTASTNDKEFGKYDGLAVERIIESLKGTNKTFIYTSGIWVVGNTGGKAATEETPLNPAQLVTWRVETERKVVEAAKQGIRTIVLRPSLVYGHDRGIVGGLIADANKTGEVKFVGEGENRWPTVHVDDVAEAYVLAFEKAKPGSLYIISSTNAVKVKELAEHIAKSLGIPGKFAGFPVEQARQRLGLFADALTLDQQFDPSKAERELGWQPKRPNIFDDITQNAKQLALVK